jgi:hypothetical protein
MNVGIADMAHNFQRHDLKHQLKDMERRIKTLETASRLRSSSIGSGGLTIRDEGDLIIEDADGNVIWSALSGPVKVQYFSGIASNFSLTTSSVTKISGSFTMPEGYSQLTVFQVANASVKNTTGSVDSFRLSLGGVFTDVSARLVGSATGVSVATVTGQTVGEVIPVQLQMNSGNASWSADAGNFANLDVLGVFLR